MVFAISTVVIVLSVLLVWGWRRAEGFELEVELRSFAEPPRQEFPTPLRPLGREAA